MWRVFGCKGSVTNDIVIKALLMAYDAGVDVINLSLGETNSWSITTDAEADVVNKIVKKGVSGKSIVMKTRKKKQMAHMFPRSCHLCW